MKAGAARLVVRSAAPVQVTSGAHVVAQIDHPLQAMMIDASGTISPLADSYSMVSATADQITAKGVLHSPGGSSLAFVDLYRASAESLSVERDVQVLAAGPNDRGFRTEFELQASGVRDLPDIEPFLPGIWYCNAQHVPPNGLVADAHQQDYLVREDRLPLPLAMVREKASGLTLALVHVQPDGSTFAGEYAPRTLIDDRMRFGSLGLRRASGISLVFAYPGVERDQSYLIRTRDHRGRVERFHPVRQGTSQHLQLLIRASTQSTFDDAMRDTWRSAYAANPPLIARVATDRVYSASIQALDHYGTATHGVMGFPFAVRLPGGQVRDVSYQMGFVGEQLPCAYHLITAGFHEKRADWIDKGQRIVDFWADNTLSPQGVPRTWYDVDPRPHWRDYKTYTRVATDGMEGMLQAWRRMRLNRRDQPRWLACCRTYGDWLVRHQNADGSYCRAYDFDGSVILSSPSATLHPVRFLIDLFNATADERYLDAARRAGRFGAADIGADANYYGGTADNNDVKDKEAGWIALDSFLALYEVTGEERWLDDADRAANFTETWTYCWNVPIPPDDPKVAVPKLTTTAGMSLIATGHSGADVFLAFAPYAYERLAIDRHDAHFASIARLLMDNPRQLVDVGGSLGYGQPGLLTEAFTLAPPRGHGMNVWLPWCSAAVLDPMQQLQDAFGTMDLDRIDQLPDDARQARLRAFARHHGFP